MSKLSELASITLKNLEELNQEPNPREYTSEFCKVLSQNGVVNEQCEFFVNALLKLSQEELDSRNGDEITSIYDILEILLKRPSSYELVKQTSNIANILELVDNSLSQAITDGKKAYLSIDSIKKEIKKSKKQENLEELRDKLINASTDVEKEIYEINNKLKEGQEEVLLLDNKIRKLEEDLNKYKKESIIDHLTKLNTRRYFDKEIEKFEDEFKRDKKDFAVVFFDLDYFKKINDNYGHECGDVILKTFATLLNKLTRKTDILARYGGEEFIACIKYKNVEELNLYIKRIKNLVVNNKFTYKDLKLNITFSAGISLRKKYNSNEETVKSADSLVYEAKENGRNQIVFDDGHII